jgi:2-polyprenyl-3-methyl-5-hydroxy-6-metoxy-1,4-benzoquinol methylase
MVTSEYRDYGWQDGMTDAHRHLYPTLRRMLEKDKDKTILDLGCGNGILATILLDEGYNVYGVDASTSGIAIAREKYPGRFFVHDLLTELLPVEIEKIRFDLIISTEVIEHLYAPKAYMRLLRRILAQRPGEVIISTPYHGYWKNLALAVTNRMDAHFAALWEGGHVKFWSRRTLTRLLNEFGFEVTQFRGSGRLPLFWKSMVVRAALSNDAREFR